jgi:hypothetical protein
MLGSSPVQYIDRRGLERELSSAERPAKGEIEPDGPLLIAAS